MEVIQNISCAAINHSWERCLNLQLPQNDVLCLQAFSHINLSLWFALLHLVHKACVKKTRPITEQFCVYWCLEFWVVLRVRMWATVSLYISFIALIYDFNFPVGDVRLTPEDFTRAQKYCKYAGSALQYEDVATALQNLQKAVKLLTTGKEWELCLLTLSFSMTDLPHVNCAVRLKITQ